MIARIGSELEPLVVGMGAAKNAASPRPLRFAAARPYRYSELTVELGQ